MRRRGLPVYLALAALAAAGCAPATKPPSAAEAATETPVRKAGPASDAPKSASLPVSRLVSIALVRTDSRDRIRILKAAISSSKKLPFESRVAAKGEPTARYYLGLTYYRQGSHLEAQHACEGALVELWQKMPAAFRKDPGNRKRIGALREILRRCACLGSMAAEREHRLNPSEFNRRQVAKWAAWSGRDMSRTSDLTHYLGLALMDEADAGAREAGEPEKAGKKDAAASKRREALKLYAEAEKKFLETSKESGLYEESLYLAGVCCYQAMSVLGYEGASPEEKAAAGKSGIRALKHYDTYRKWVKAHPPKARSSDSKRAAKELKRIKGLRKSHAAAITLYEPWIHCDLDRLPEAIKAAEALRGRKDLDAVQQRTVHRFLFRAYVAEAGRRKTFAEAAGYLLKAEAEAGWFVEQRDKTADLKERAALTSFAAHASGKLEAAWLEAVKRALKEGVDEAELEKFLKKSRYGRDTLQKLKDGVNAWPGYFIREGG